MTAEGTRMKLPGCPSNRDADKGAGMPLHGQGGKALLRMMPSRETGLRRRERKKMLLGRGIGEHEMKAKKLICLLLAAVLAMSMFTACISITVPGEQAPVQEDAEPEAEPAGEDTGITVTDMLGRTITLDEPATRVVALSAADCEFLFAVGAGDTLVGRGEYCDYPAEVFDVPSVQSGYETNIEEIIALEPQVLLMSTMAQTEEQVQQLEDAGIRVVVSDAQDIAGVYQAVEMIGTLMGKEKEAAEVIDQMKTSLEELQEEAKDLPGGTIYFEVSPLQWGLWAAGKGTFMDEVANLLGLTNVFADVDAWGEVSEEEVISRNPDYIVTISMYYGEGPTPEEEILSRAGWENVNAVKNNAILNLPNNELSRPTPRIADGARMLLDFVREASAAKEE